MRFVPGNSRQLLGAAGFIFLCCTAVVAYQAAATPDLSVFSFSDLNAPNKNATLDARIHNSSSLPINTDVTFYKGSVTAGNAVQIDRQTVSLAAFSNTLVSSPKMATSEGELYSVCVDAAKTVSESNENNNCDVRVVSAAAGDLTITTAGISMTPAGANVGEAVLVTANVQSVRNTATRALVRLFQGHPQSPSARQLGQTTISVPANGFAPASWTIVRPAGETNFFVSVDDVYPRDVNRANNLASRNVYLKAIIDTGRMFGGNNRASTMPAVGDLLGTGQPVLVFGEHTGSSFGTDGRVTAVQVQTDGTTKEIWSKQLVPAPSEVFSPSMADLDGDGSPEIIVQLIRRLGTDAAPDGEIHVFALDKNGNKKWSSSWRTPGTRPCKNYRTSLTPVLGDMNKDGVADVVMIDTELVILDGRNGGQLLRVPNLPAGANWCTSDGYAAIADLDDDGSNEIIVGKFGIHVFNSNGSLRWKTENNNMYMFSITDTDKDGKPEIVVPVHRQRFDILDARTGALKKRVVPSPWSPFDSAIAVTTSLDPTGLPSIAITNNDSVNGTGLLDNQLKVKWWTPSPVQTITPGVENPHHIALADLLGQGRPQVISRSDRRSIGIQDIRDGSWLLYTSIFGFGSMEGWPIPVDADGDGHGDVIIQYGSNKEDNTRVDYEAQLEPANFLIFSSDHWAKIPVTWNQHQFVPGQVDRNLAFRHDYKPYKTHNTWMQQPLRMVCDVDYDEDVDQNDINLIYSARGQKASAGDWRDADKDGEITVSDGRVCALKCTKANCAAINQPAHILSVNPRVAFPGSTVPVTIRGEFGGFRAGQTTVNVGAGITVGSVTVLDSDTLTARLTIAAGQTGDRTVTVATGSVVVSRPAGFSVSAGNRPPVVQVGADQQLTLPGTITLSGTVTDDKLPSGTVTTSWQMVGGPGVVTFSNPNALVTTASFSKAGYYHLRLSATDGQYVASDDMGVVAIAGNQAPFVNAGQDLTARQDVPLRMSGDVQDDGLPSRTLNSSWSFVSGPGTATFNPANSASTLVSFSAPGVYVLRLTASDSQMSASDDLTVTVNPPPAEILSITPDSAVPGQATVTIRTKYTKFVNGTTEANFGPGISVGGAAANSFGKVTVVDAITATAQLQIAPNAAAGMHVVTIRTGTEIATKSEGFLVGAIGVPSSIRVNPSDLVIGPGGSITVQPQLVDAAGNVISGGAQVFTLTVTSKPGKTTGNAPKVNGLSVSFPKLTKRMMPYDTTKDPEGKYAVGDPTDVNYGKETGGVYTLNVSMQGVIVTGTVDVAVLPSGTADITLKVKQYGEELRAAFRAVADAAAARNVPAFLAARGQLSNVLANREFSVKLLSTNHVLAPPNGFPVTPAQVSGRFPIDADDENFGKMLDALIVHLRITRSRLEAINPAAFGQADIDAIRAAMGTYKTLSQQLAALSPGTLGVVANTRKVNDLMRDEMPLFLETLGRKAMELLNEMPGDAQLKNGFTRSALSDIDFYLNVMSEAFPLMTDGASYLEGNIVELGITLTNSLVNIALANIINYFSNGAVAIDFVAAGSDFSFACPLYPNTYVEGEGFSANPNDNSVAVIGCINSNAIRTLIGLKFPGTSGPDTSLADDLAASLRAAFDLKSLAEAANSGFGFASVETPTQMREGLFGGSQMVFRLGWPAVNKSRVPCTGIVIAFNRENGGFHAVNTNMLPSCQ